MRPKTPKPQNPIGGSYDNYEDLKLTDLGMNILCQHFSISQKVTRLPYKQINSLV